MTKLVVQSVVEAGVLTPTATPPKIIDVKWEPPDPGWVELRLDSIVVVRCLQGRSDGSVAGAHLIHSIQELMLCDWQVKVKHIYQEVNKRADLLANIGCDLNVSEHVYDVPPSSLGQVLLSNVMGVSTPRSIPL